MQKYLFHYIIIGILCLLTGTSANAQKKNTLAIGLNFSYFSGWEKIPLNFFNPEIIYLRQLNNNKQYLISFDTFYGWFPQRQNVMVGSVLDRLIFSLKANYLLTKNKTSFGIGPSIRYRKEMKVVSITPRYVGVDPNEFHTDIGINASVLHNFTINKNTSLLMKLNYSIHNKGQNPISVGVFYGLDW